MTSKTIFATLMVLSAVYAQAQDVCSGLTPKGGEDLTESFKGAIEGEVKGIVSKLAGGSASIEGEYLRLERDTLKEYPEANKVFVWQSIVYLACVRPEAGIDINRLFELYLTGPPKAEDKDARAYTLTITEVEVPYRDRHDGKVYKNHIKTNYDIIGKFSPEKDFSVVRLEHYRKYNEHRFRLSIDSRHEEVWEFSGRYDVDGVCLSKDTERLKLLISGADVSASAVADIYEIYFDHVISHLKINKISGVEYVDLSLADRGVFQCAEGESSHFHGIFYNDLKQGQLREQGLACRCTYEADRNAQSVVREFLETTSLEVFSRVQSFDSLQSESGLVKLPYYFGVDAIKIPNRTMQRFVERFATIPNQSSVNVEFMRLESFEILSLFYDVAIDNSWFFVLAKPDHEDEWAVAYYDFDGNNKRGVGPGFACDNFGEAKLVSLDANSFGASICVRDCGWWGEFEDYRFDLKKGMAAKNRDRLCQ